MDTTLGTDNTKRVTLDVNQVISPTLAVRAGGLFQDADVAGRNYVTDDRNGGFVAATWKAGPMPSSFTGNYIHTELTGIPDFGRALLQAEHGEHRRRAVSRTLAPIEIISTASSSAISSAPGRDIGSFNAEVQITPDLGGDQQVPGFALEPELHRKRCLKSPSLTTATLSANPQSRLQITDVLANQSEATYKFNDGVGFNHTRARRCRIRSRKIVDRQICRAQLGK